MLRRRQRRPPPGEWRPGGERPRVLVENPDRAAAHAYARVLAARGYAVALCTGPSLARDGDGVRCPLLEGEPCPLVEGADVVVSTRDLARSRDILAVLAPRGVPPVVFEAPRPALGEYRDMPGRVTLLPVPVTEATLLAAVEEARALAA